MKLFIRGLQVALWAVACLNTSMSFATPSLWVDWVVSPILESYTPPPFEPVERHKKYFLQIDSAESFFDVQNFDYSEVTVFSSIIGPKIIENESAKYPINGRVEISESYKETASYISEWTKIDRVEAQFGIGPVELADNYWFDQDFLVSSFESKEPNNYICSCQSTYIIDWLSPQTNLLFDGDSLLATGQGFFTDRGLQGLQLAEDWESATHFVRYQVTASVVATAPVPGAFLLFASGFGLLFGTSRWRKDSLRVA